jgi:type IV secretory pathway TraG/TraD family ATPase VirD4
MGKFTLKKGEIKSEGRSERPIPLITAQEIMQLKDHDVIGFHRRLPPFKMKRVEWWRYPLL